ncbi:hypothetical protein [Microbacterium terricola]|uniref:Flp pilus-assembly TadG-like N-terminal domain-containing protein n=1 Tax=Microbacterium terricola TaxID=344163 RepID=A0ABM8DXK0_9MICO|nr:hypothetical protein [Microbacterium terricola]UYK38946.1 hypothetical protein OAU46_09520 [Microbacterium terricola]BDV30354.1 hypothetical protein Microterr_10140 [Microbacterium terricola]
MLVNRLTRRLRATAEGEDGSTLIAVLIVAMILGLLTVTLSAAVVNTTKTTLGVGSSLQAQAAADAGIAAAVAAAKAHPADVCTIDITSSTPRYHVKPALPSPERPDVTACGAGGKVTFLSIGTGEDGRTTSVEATYFYTGGVATGVPDNAVVIGGGTFSATSLMLKVGAGGADGSALMLSGDFKTCNNITTFETDVILYNGNLEPTNSCKFMKNVYVAGYVKMSAGATVGGSIYALGTVTLANAGNTVGGDIVAKGNVSMTAGATVSGGVITEGNLSITNSPTTIGGNVAVGGDVSMSSGAKINGNLTATGKVTIGASPVAGNLTAGGQLDVQSTTIGGAIIGAHPGDQNFYNVKAASMTVAGTYKANLQTSKITGDVVSTKAGGVSYIAPDTIIGGKLRLAGTASTGWGPPTAAGGNSYNVTGLTAPTVPAKPIMTIPDELKTGTYKWDDYDYVQDNWIAGGYTVDVWPTAPDCTFDTWHPANVAKIASYTTPTVVDLRKCAKVYGFQTTLQLDADLLILLPDNDVEHKFQEVTFSSKDGQPHKLDFLMPDTVDNDSPTCKKSGSKINLYATKASTSPLISGLIYTPCTLSIANVGANGNWTGQLYSGSMIFDAGGAPGYQLVYQPIGVPGFGVSTASAAALGALISRRDMGAP